MYMTFVQYHISRK